MCTRTTGHMGNLAFNPVMGEGWWETDPDTLSSQGPSLRAFCRLPDRWTDRQEGRRLGRPSVAAARLSRGDKLSGPESPGGQYARLQPGSASTCEKGKQVSLSSSLQHNTGTNTTPNYWSRSDLLGLRSVMVQKITLGHWGQ